MKEFFENDEVIDVEKAALAGKLPPKGKKYKYKVDDKDYTTDQESLTGRQILTTAGKVPPEQHILRQKIHGKWITVGLNETVDFTTSGVEKFKTLPNDQTEGEINAKSPRRDFELLEEDEEFLESLGLFWETVRAADNVSWLLVHGYKIIEGYNVDTATLAINLVPGYPTSQLDMVFFNPPLARDDGQSISNLSDLTIDGKTFQQWSRHRTEANPWRANVDNLSTHYPLAEAWLKKEFEKRPRYAVSA